MTYNDEHLTPFVANDEDFGGDEGIENGDNELTEGDDGEIKPARPEEDDDDGNFNGEEL